MEHMNTTAVTIDQESRDLTWQEVFQRPTSLHYPDKKEHNLETVPQGQEQAPPKHTEEKLKER